MRVDELRPMRAPVFGLLVVLAADLLVTIAYSLGHRLASIRARQLNDEFAFAWLPVASTSLRLFLTMLLVALLSTLWSRVRDQLRTAVRASAVVMTVAWIAQLLSAERLLLELGPACMGNWQFVIVCSDISRILGTFALARASSSIGRYAPGAPRTKRAPFLSSYSAVMFSVAGTIVFWGSVFFVQGSDWASITKVICTFLSIASQFSLLVAFMKCRALVARAGPVLAS